MKSLPDKTEKPFDIHRWVENGTNLIAFLGASGIVMIALVVVLDVLMRWIINAPIMGVDDLCVYVLAVSVATFFPLGLAKGHFVTVQLLGKALGERFARWFEVFGAACTLGFFVLVAWRMSVYSLEVTRSGLATVVLQFRQAPWWWTVTAVMIVCIPVQACVLVEKFLIARHGHSPDGPSKAGEVGLEERTFDPVT